MGTLSEKALDLDEMQALLPKFTNALRSFASSNAKFQLLNTVGASSTPPSAQTLYVLDSSFNPPTRAHFKMAVSALENDRGKLPKRLLLLLATSNADKAPKPASFEQRLTMMTMIAHDLHTHASCHSAAVDIGLTSEPYFMAKSYAISDSSVYTTPAVDAESPKTSSPEQVWLTGYDTLTRIFDPKYYSPTHTLAPLEPFLQAHRIRATFRPDDSWGSIEEQEDFLRQMAQGGREKEGGKREWAERIELVEGRTEGEEIISSTKVRAASKRRDEAELGKLVNERVRDWILHEHLYTEE
ncbi:MAG: hypothetical protein M1819_005030 [Sarea resinae]|nr:MAG: hypothetical protein M1819_005030 [Sarea resinae]